jgi:hypothetical protein
MTQTTACLEPFWGLSGKPSGVESVVKAAEFPAISKIAANYFKKPEILLADIRGLANIRAPAARPLLPRDRVKLGPPRRALLIGARTGKV